MQSDILRRQREFIEKHNTERYSYIFENNQDLNNYRWQTREDRMDITHSKYVSCPSYDRNNKISGAIYFDASQKFKKLSACGNVCTRTNPFTNGIIKGLTDICCNNKTTSTNISQNITCPTPTNKINMNISSYDTRPFKPQPQPKPQLQPQLPTQSELQPQLKQPGNIGGNTGTPMRLQTPFKCDIVYDCVDLYKNTSKCDLKCGYYMAK